MTIRQSSRPRRRVRELKPSTDFVEDLIQTTDRGTLFLGRGHVLDEQRQNLKHDRVVFETEEWNLLREAVAIADRETRNFHGTRVLSYPLALDT